MNVGTPVHVSTASNPAAKGRSTTWILAATILGSSLAFIDGSVVNVALPVLQRDLNASAADVQWVIEAYSLFLASLILVGGSLGDRYGRRRVYTLGVAIFSIASVICGLAPTVGVLIVARGVQGIGGALLVPGSLAIISSSFSGDTERGRAIGTWSAFTTLTSAGGPVLGGWLVQSVSWRAIFFINVPIAALVLLLLARHVPESKDDSISGPLDWAGAVAVTLGLAALVYGFITWGSSGVTRSVVVSISIGVICLIGFVLVEARSTAPMLPLSLFRSRTFTGTNLLTFLLYGALGGTLFYLPFDLQQAQGYSATAAGAALVPLTIVLFALSRWAGGLVGRYGAKLPLTIGPIIAAVGFFLLSLPRGGNYWTDVFPGVLVLGLGMAVTVAPLTTAVMGAVDPRHSGVASGVNNAVSRAAGLLAIAVLGIVVAYYFSSGLDHRLNAIQLAPAARHALDANRDRLAALGVPTGLSASQAAEVHRAIIAAFIDGYQAVMRIGAVLALLSALFAALLVEGRPTPRAA